MGKKMMAVAVALVALVSMSGCEPAMTITASTPGAPTCWEPAYVSGAVAPVKATPKVWLQIQDPELGWQDWQWYETFEDGAARPLSASVQADGSYNLRYVAPDPGKTVRLRIRSDAGSAVSKSMYVRSVDPASACA